MQALDNFISPIPGFDSDIPFSTIPVLARPPGDGTVGDRSAEASASAPKTRAGTRKATPNLTPQKKGQESRGGNL
jgi:hypothetical protein